MVVDPGHGGSDRGCTYGGLCEKDLTLKIGLAVSRALNTEGASVIMTRNDDSYPSLGRRSDIANSSHADAFVSIHINDVSSNAPDASMTFFHGSSNSGMLLATCIQTELAIASPIHSWGPKNDYTRFRGSGMAVLRNTSSAAVLMEVGFIDNSFDRATMIQPDFPDRVAQAVARGLQRFFGGRSR